MKEDVRKILVVSWMTSESRQAVHYGISLARKYGAELSVIHVIHNPFGLKGWNLPVVSLKEDYDRLLAETKTELDRIIREEQGRGMEIRELIKEGEPVTRILQTIREDGIDLLIMPAHQESRIEHFLVGRTNDELLRSMPCSILLVKQEPQRVKF